MPYKAKQGDIIFLSFDPQAGHEQKGRRPALVVSNESLNSYYGTSAMVCPITNTKRRSPFHVELDNRTKTTGVVMCDQVKALDVRERKAEFFEKVPDDILFEAADIVSGFTEIE